MVIYLLLCAAIYVFQRALIYHPAEATEHPFDTLEINNDNHIIEALKTNPVETKQGTGDVIIYFGGNAENVAYSAADFNQQFPNHQTFLMKYRGYAGAAGSPSEQALFSDALALFDHIKQNSNARIHVIGRSLGSGVATYLATQRQVDKLILVTPFDSILNLAKNMFPILPVEWLLKDHFNSKSRAHQINTPTLVITATNDQVIPKQHSESLIQSIPKTQLTVINIDAGHNDIDLYPLYFNSLKSHIAIN
ncbi:hypothetical protein MNBD_GAMMA02-65 [hydrothermal vent metagenome]|uniref:Serine hydrolase domain-containing protein n=1 Tax=hydrothermal vent metagenome TaxID=652676 RepID=A0A3B0VQH8_9ZZZZ